MPSAFDYLGLPTSKTINSAFDSDTFDADATIHVDGLVGSATISPSGRDVALASPDGLAIIDLDSPYSPPRRVSSHGLPWLVVDVQWSPFAARDYWIASTANHRCLVWNLNLRDDSPSGAIEHSLGSHSRAITDINFSAHHPDMLATCAVDGYVHCWDLRRPRRPALTFCDWFAGATQVKYNRQDGHVLASSHDRFLHIWDDRKTSEPLKSISAHTSKIYGLDWNRTRKTGIVTCSLDKSIKFWDYGDDDVPHRVIRTDFPVWRARHTPFGWGLLAMPQNEPGKLYLYDRRASLEELDDERPSPVAVFPGHGDHKVKEFLWRSRGELEDDRDYREFQLVSWGADSQLRLQTPHAKDLEAVGHVRGGRARENLIITRKGATYKTFRTVDDGGTRDVRSGTINEARPDGGLYQRSALTLGMHAPQRLGPVWKAPSMKARTTVGRDVDRSQLQIGWMRGITMNKKRKTMAGSKEYSMFSPSYHDGAWGEPDTIHEEFVRLTHQLPNVEWDNIDMDSLTLRASLEGPWGAEGSSIFIKVKVDIPPGYPMCKAPKFSVEKTSFMTEETHKKMEQELQQVARQFLQKKQNCLIVAFTYLLGEVDLEGSTSFFKNVADFDDEIDGLEDESSSEDEDMATGHGMSQELTASIELDPSAILAPTQRVGITITPRFCGARFCGDGKLVCFFPTEGDSGADPNREKARAAPSFAGFGRLAQASPPTKKEYDVDGASTDDQSGTSDDSDASSSSSSDSELTTMHKVNLWYRPGRGFRKTWSINESIRSSAAGTGTGTGTATGTGTLRRRIAKSKNVVSVYDLAAELPSKKQFAQEYAIFGEGAHVCRHNAHVADKYGFPHLSDVWNYAALLLQKGIPLELHQQRHQRESVLVIAKDSLAREDDEATEPTFLGRVRWGFHPLAQDFIHDLFDHFERLADVQMLAMLSCIFCEASTKDSVALAELQLSQPETPLPMKAPSFSLDYFPTDPALWTMANKSPFGSPRFPNTPTPVMCPDSQASDDVAWTGFSSSFSCSDPRPGRERLQTQSLSVSPEHRMPSFRRSNSTVAATLAASLPRAIAGMVAASPLDAPARKRPSPGETFLSNITWGSTTVFGAAASEPTAPTSTSDDDHFEDATPLVPVAVSCVSSNQGLFDDDGWLCPPLLAPDRDAIYAGYRYAYAEMLHLWGQPLARLEIMKFNVLKERTVQLPPHVTITSNVATGTSTPTVSATWLDGRREQLKALLASGRGLDVKGICRIHEEQLDPLEYSQPTHGKVGGAVGTCHKCEQQRGRHALATTTAKSMATSTSKARPMPPKPPPAAPQTQLRCVYCLEPVHALYPPCLACGCASHEACLAEWHAAGERECPAGDECDCVAEASNGQVESWQALQAAMRSGGTSARHGRHKRRRALHSRSRRPSVPAHGDEDGTESEEDMSSGSSSSSDHVGLVGSGRQTAPPTAINRVSSASTSALTGLLLGKKGPSVLAGGDQSPARLSLGNRLKRSLGEATSAGSSVAASPGDGRPRLPRAKSVGVGVWKMGLDAAK